MTGGALTTAETSAAVWFELPQLRSKSNFRRGANTKSWNRLQGFEDELAITARSHRPASWPMGDAAAPVASRPAIIAVVVAETLLDTGNVTKSLYDALEGVLYHTDASIRAELVVTERAKGGRAFAAFAVCEHGDAASYARAVAGLAEALLASIQD
jgi:hypothetical protein